MYMSYMNFNKINKTMKVINIPLGVCAYINYYTY